MCTLNAGRSHDATSRTSTTIHLNEKSTSTNANLPREIFQRCHRRVRIKEADEREKERRVNWNIPANKSLVDSPESTEAHRIMNVRRLPGFMYHYKVVTLFLFSTFLLVIYLLLHWGIMCTNLEAWRHVSNVVSRFERYNAVQGSCITVTRRRRRARRVRRLAQGPRTSTC